MGNRHEPRIFPEAFPLAERVDYFVEIIFVRSWLSASSAVKNLQKSLAKRYHHSAIILEEYRQSRAVNLRSHTWSRPTPQSVSHLVSPILGKPNDSPSISKTPQKLKDVEDALSP